MLDPLAVALKFSFLAALYVFLLWVARSAVKDLRRASILSDHHGDAHYGGDSTGLYEAAESRSGPDFSSVARLRVEGAAGLPTGAAYDLSQGALLGRGDDVEIKLDDSYASAHHARFVAQGEMIVLEDLDSTNGTYLNGERLRGPQPLHVGDHVRIGDSEFVFER